MALDQHRLLRNFSFVAASRYRERVMASLGAKTKLPREVAEDTDLRMVHVSRALRELRDQGLAECLTPWVKARGRIYALTEAGANLFAYMNDSNRRFVPFSADLSGPVAFVRKIRASAIIPGMEHLRRVKGDASVRETLRNWSVDLEGLTNDTWISVDAYAEYLELIEGKFGDGSYSFIRNLWAQSAGDIPSVREQVLKIIPLEALSERAPIVYNKEFNYGRLEVKVGKGQASFLYFERLPTAAMCAVSHGVLEGVLRARSVQGSVTKTRCVRRGDTHCEYSVEWKRDPRLRKRLSG